ncbi:MAG: YraN family protein [Patescibacteria group bacterium]|nr:YraN family protein [Patescibacteria group bacterium]
MRSPKELGNFGERIAADYLEKKGYKILAQNFKRKWGEIDIVGRLPQQNFWGGGKKKDRIVFFEVKTILEKEGFSPEDELSPKKKRQLLKMAQIYLSENRIPLDSPYQIDIVAVELSPDFKKTKIRHYDNAIEDRY